MKEKKLRIYFTSDIHGQFFPVNYTDNTPIQAGMINIICNYHKDENTLVIDAGDILQGSPYTQMLAERNGIAGNVANLMNRAGVDYVTLGNHDFMYGYDFLKSYLKPLKAKCLCVNIQDKTDKLPIFPSAIHTLKNGLRIGLIGASTDWVSKWESEEHMRNFKVDKVLNALPEEAKKLKAETDFLIGIYHGGFEVDVDSEELLTDSDENVGYQICAQCPFDLLLTGHQHMAIVNKTLCGTHVVQSPAKASHYVYVEAVQKKEEQSFQIVSELKPAGSLSDPLAVRKLETDERECQDWLDEVLGVLPKAYLAEDKLTMALNGNDLAKLVGQLMLEKTGSDISCCALLNDVEGLPQKVTRRQIAAMAPFPGSLVVRRINGRVLKEALERTAEYFEIKDGRITVSQTFLKPKVEHYHFDFFYGIEYQYDPFAPIGSRVTYIRFKGRDLKAEDELTLTLTDYRSSGTGGYPMYLPCPIIAAYPYSVADLLTEWVTSKYS